MFNLWPTSRQVRRGPAPANSARSVPLSGGRWRDDVKVYNASGGALTKNGVYRMTTGGASATTPNPQVAAPGTSLNRHHQWVVAQEAIANNSWGWATVRGYTDILVEGTVDVAADDPLRPVEGQIYLVKDASGEGIAAVADALAAQTANSAVATACFLPGARTPLEAGQILVVEVALTNAEIKALRATPKTLVAAPGAGRVLELVSIVLFHDYGGTNVFTETADNLAVKYNNGSGAAASETIEMTGFIDQSADTMTVGVAKNDQIVAKSGCENLALVLHNTGDGEFGGNAGNDNVMRAKVSYRNHNTGW